MAWAWVADGRVFISFSDDMLPNNVDILEVPDNTTIFDLVFENGRLRLKTEEERLLDLKQKKERELKRHVSILLSQTDWVAIKMWSLRIEGLGEEEIQNELQKYHSVLERRKKVREWANKMKEAIWNAQTIEDLIRLRIEFTEE